MRETVNFFVNGRPDSAGGNDARRLVSDWLRRERQLVGTKVVCAEGDCGACATLLGRVNAAGDGVVYEPVCSCILFVFQLDGCHLVTIEGLSCGGDRGDDASPDAISELQRALAEGHGTQCGFCTPGFVVTLHDLLSKRQDVTAGQVRRAIVGHLCRCTGYDAIVRSAVACDASRLPSLDTLYPPGQMLPRLKAWSADRVRVPAPAGAVHRPATLEDAVAVLADEPDTTLIAGATDLGVLAGKRLRPLGTIVSIGHLPELRGIQADIDAITFGAAVTWSEAATACRDVLPELTEFLKTFGSPLIRHAGTLGGNLITGSPIGDGLPPLCVLGATVDLVSRDGRRSVDLNAFYTGYRRTVLRPGELLASVRVPRPRPGECLRLYKVSRRTDMDISTFSAAMLLRHDGRTIELARVAFGGVAATVLRMRECEEWLAGKPLEETTFADAGRMAAASITPLNDVRGSAAYRERLAETVFLKCFYDLTQGQTCVVREKGRVS